MNYSTAIFLISDAVRGVMVAYEADENAPLTFFKTLNSNIKVDDYVVVPTNSRHKMTVCQVREVDVEPDFDLREDVKWIIGTVDRADFEDIQAQESTAITRIQSAEKRKKREELRDALLADVGEDEIKALPVFGGE